MNNKHWMPLGIFLVALLSMNPVQAAPSAGVGEKVAALKKALQENQARLKKYEWVETLIVSKNGEEKSRKQYRCYYGVDGTLTKILLDASQAQGRMPRGIRGRIVEHKKEELTDYMEQASNLIKRYIPPQSSKIQASLEANKVSIKPDGPNKNVELVFQDYLMPGDSLGVNLNLADLKLMGLSVNTYLDNPKDTVTMKVSFSTLPDGTEYPKQTLLTAKKKNITVQSQNSGYRKVGS